MLNSGDKKNKASRFSWSLHSCDWRGTKNKQIIVISGGDKCHCRHKQDFLIRWERDAALNRMVREGFSEEMTFE